MSSPMFDLPEHMLIPVNEDGDGPVDGADAARWACWCGSDCDGDIGSNHPQEKE